MLSGKTFRYLFVSVAVLIAIVSVWVTNRLTDELKNEERKKIELLAETISVISSQAIANQEYIETLEDRNMLGVKQFIDNAFVAYDSLLLSRIVEGNHTIPVIITDEYDSIASCRNVLPSELENLPAPTADFDLENDTSPDAEHEIYDFSSILEQNGNFLRQKLKEFAKKHEPVEIRIDEGIVHHVYYDDSTTLKRLQLFPYVQLGVVFIFILVSFIALNSTKKAEQNRVWVGLSKETAHQLGTPISSLMAWVEYLKSKHADPKIMIEIDKDVQRLKTIAERFSKIGSGSTAEPMDLEAGVTRAVEYLGRRISSKVSIHTRFPEQPLTVLMNESLFGWVIENLVKNAVDAMNGQGDITIAAIARRRKVILDVSDTGKGIPKSKFDAVFRPGYTTKERGWGLGLSLVRRIVESYHKGKIYVHRSEAGKGTTFRIELKLFKDKTK